MLCAMSEMLKAHWRSLIPFFILVIIIQLVGAAVTFPNIPDWYMDLNRAPWSPPNWAFGPVWTVLYIILAVYGWALWHKFYGRFQSRFRQPVIKAYFLQLFFNFLWSPLFFWYHYTWLAFFDLVLVIYFTNKTMKHTRYFSVPMSRWLVPYMIWLCYAATLNYYIAAHN